MNAKKNAPTRRDAAAVAEAGGVLARAAKFIEALQETHAQHPGDLGRGTAAIRRVGLCGDHRRRCRPAPRPAQRCQGAAGRRCAPPGQRRRRSAGARSPKLGRARVAVDQARSEVAATILGEFMGRWNHACRELAKLHAEAAALSAALRAKVNCPPPYSATMSVVSGQPEARLSLPVEPQPVTLPPALAGLAGVLDQLDGVLAMLTAIKQARQLDSRHYHLTLQRGAATERGGVDPVVAEFVCPVDGFTA